MGLRSTQLCPKQQLTQQQQQQQQRVAVAAPLLMRVPCLVRVRRGKAPSCARPRWPSPLGPICTAVPARLAQCYQGGRLRSGQLAPPSQSPLWPDGMAVGSRWLWQSYVFRAAWNAGVGYSVMACMPKQPAIDAVAR
jgi:hypothetical protein